MAVVSMKQLLEAGVHFGHLTRRWNPKMAKYIYTSRQGIYIIDLQKTADEIEKGYKALNEIVKDGGKVLFVGTKKQASEAIKSEAIRCGHFYVDHRWLGGTLTNFKTIRKRIKRLHDLYKMEKDGVFDVLPKKEVIKLKLERTKLEKFLGGIKEMKRTPQALFIVDPRKERNAILEARKLNIPVFGIVDTNCDPDDVDYVIPGNDDAVRSVKLISWVFANAVIEAQGGEVPVPETLDLASLEEETPFKDNPRRKPRKDDSRDDRPKRDFKKEDRPKREFKKDDSKTAAKPAQPKPEEKVEVKPVVKEEPKVVAKEEVKEPVKKAVKEEKVEAKKAAPKADVDYSKMTVAELKEIAKEKKITGISKLKKDELIEVIKNA